MYFKFTEKAPEDGRRIKYEAVIIEASTRQEAVLIFEDEFKGEKADADHFRIDEARDLFQAKPLLESIKSFIIIHSAKKLKESEE